MSAEGHRSDTYFGKEEMDFMNADLLSQQKISLEYTDLCVLVNTICGKSLSKISVLVVIIIIGYQEYLLKQKGVRYASMSFCVR